ncbi:oxidoreductase [Acrocarpospora pleiomorpha]|uniref:Oxidoreductase n=1 Tax=Acrocarpospora pleiomorpha TaxID=90975 RepID=A0A5M3XW92_9ACTN|nr:FAD-dependent oxidoreductase [Acrocarpospora pleiomorpha]GES24349.1 oxidoreductase [Acrocarpospora pleiomorpha]
MSQLMERHGYLGPGDPGYDEARRTLNPDLDPRPALVAEAREAEDVVAAVRVARELDLALTVRATGHGTHVACDERVLLLRTSNMSSVTIDPERRTARVGPGARWGQVIASAAPYGLVPLAGSHPDVGVIGYTLGGGLGWLSRRYGFAADSVLRAEIVTSEGRMITADPDHHADLFWALRGGGGGFGVVTALEFRLYPVPVVYAGAATFPVERAAETLAFYRDWCATAPDEVSTALVLTPQSLTIKAMCAGPTDLLRPLWATAITDTMAPMPFGQAAMGGTAARHLDLFPSLPDATIDTLVRAGREATVEVRHWGGALAKPGGPVSHRDTRFSVIVDAQLPGVAETLAPYAGGGVFLNFLSDTSRTADAYTRDDYNRLIDVKRAYDPADLFRTGHRIPL